MAIIVGTVGGSVLELKDLDVGLLFIGATITPIGSTDVYRLLASSASVDHDAVESVKDNDTLRWVKESAMTAADRTKLDALPGPWTTVGPTIGDAQDLTLATGLDVDANGGIEIYGYLAAAAGLENYFLQPNGADTGDTSASSVAAPGLNSRYAGSNLRLAAASATDLPWFHCTITGTSTGVRTFEAVSADQTDPASVHTAGTILPVAGNITSVVIHGSSSDSIKAGSVFKWRYLNIG